MILAVESSCDETAVAVVDRLGKVHFNVCFSQIDLHNKYGGVVPELASRSHFEVLGEIATGIETALKKNQIQIEQITAVAATMGPGLIGPLLVGSSFARGLAFAWDKPFIGVHHLRAHVASALLALDTGELLERAEKTFPAWVLLVSGGHCLLLEANQNLELKILKSTSDDAAGECFDKCAKLMGLPYPGGPAIQRESQKCKSKFEIELAQEWADKLPRPKSLEGFSFAGLKTAFRLLTEHDDRTKSNLPALARALEIAIIDSLLLVIQKTYAQGSDIKNFICCGGVAANLHLRENLSRWCKSENINLFTVPFEYATDNAVMVAVAAQVQAKKLSETTVFSRGQLETQ